MNQEPTNPKTIAKKARKKAAKRDRKVREAQRYESRRVKSGRRAKHIR